MSDFKAHSATFADIVDLDDDSNESGPLERGILDTEQTAFWAAWRRRLRNKHGYVKARTLLKNVLPEPVPIAKSKKKRKVVVDESPLKAVDKDGALEVEQIEIDEEKMHEEMRILIKVMTA